MILIYKLSAGRGREHGENMTDGHRESHLDAAYLLRQLSRAKPLLNVLSEHVVFQDTEHGILWANEAAAGSVDADGESLAGRRCYTVWMDRNTPCPACPVEAALQSGAARQGEMETPDGKAWLVRATPLRDEKGMVCGAVESTLEVTDRKHAEEQVARLNDMLRLINKIMRHDIVNHLNVAQGALDVFEDEGDLSLLETARSRMLQGMELIRRMRELESLVGAGGRLQPYSLRDVVAEALAGCPLDCSIEGEGTALADDAIYPAVDNIVRNAVMHADAEHIDVSINEDGDTVELRVADDGRGIPDEIKQRVLDERYSHGRSGGSGLGLYIVRETVERYGGSIEIRDNEPRGTAVVIRLQRGGIHGEA